MGNTRLYHWRHWPSLSPPTAPPVVFFHGFLGSSQDWSDIVVHFQDRDCWAVDLPGHGQTPILGTDSFELALDRLIHDIQIFGQPVDIVAYSMGGRLAMHVADRHPACIRHLIIESASPGIDRPAERRARAVFDDMVIHKLKMLCPQEFIDWWCAFPMFGDLQDHPRYPELRDRRAGFDPQQTEWAYRILGATHVPSLWSTIHRLGMSAYITGEHDVKYRQIAAQIERDCPLTDVRILKNLAHNCHFEAPELFSSLILSILDRSTPA